MDKAAMVSIDVSQGSEILEALERAHVKVSASGDTRIRPCVDT